MLPEKFTERMREMLGEEYLRFLECYERDVAHALRVNSLKCAAETLRAQAPFTLTPVPWNENGFYYDGGDRPGRHPYHAAGVYYIQEASAMVPAMYLGPKPGERVLDLCAAPGGKSTQIGAAMEQRGILILNEIHPARAGILTENVERMGIRNAIVTNETPGRLAEAFPEYFDRILVDAPCSGEGMFRKNEEAVSQWSPENVELCAARQDEILISAARMLAPGGRLVYSTCTFAPQENEGTITRFLAKHPDFQIEPVEKFPGMAPGVPEWAWKFESGQEKTEGTVQRDSARLRTAPLADSVRPVTAQKDSARLIAASSAGLDGTIRLWPHKIRGEGHFVAVLRKMGTLPEKRSVPVQRGLKEKDAREYLDFARENLGLSLAGILIKRKDQLYLAPSETPSLEGLKVLRPGLHLGTVKKGRFEPAHALALTLQPEEVRHSLYLPADSREICAYLRGETLPVEGEKGWYLMTVDGYSVGWGKQSGGVMKNHYPKGLRKP